MTEVEKIVAIIKGLGCWNLGHWDGCCCSYFSIRNVDIRISCGKNGDQSVWVTSRSCDYDDVVQLRPVMAEIIKQLKEHSGRGGYFNENIFVGDAALAHQQEKT